MKKIACDFGIKTVLAIICLTLPALAGKAQFYSFGDDPGRIRWNHFETPHYRIIYPRGADSLAIVYGNEFEKYVRAEAISSGMTLKDGKRRKFPLIIHAWNGVSNAAVTWAPKRLDIFTLPSVYDSEPMSWATNLAIHEGRHISQMQLGYKGWLKPLTIILGEMAPGAYSAIWPSTWLLEGDAVIAETALSNSGRGRSSDFLEYYRTAFPEGVSRDWYSWRYGSYRHYSPDHYALGYITAGGVRYFYDDPLFTERYFSRIQKNPFRFFNTQKTVKAASGMKFRKTFRSMTDSLKTIWEEDRLERGPFITSHRLSEESRWYTKLYGNVYADGYIYAIYAGLADAAMLVRIDPATGEMKKLRSFESGTSRLAYSDGKLWWSETAQNTRWTLQNDSQIRYYDIRTGKMRSLTGDGRYYNPSPAPYGKCLAAVSMPRQGGSELVLISTTDGEVLRTIPIPGNLQATEVCPIGKSLIFSAISDEGFGIYSIAEDGTISNLTTPSPVSIRNLRTDGKTLYFACDRTGTNELYRLDPLGGDLRQLTSLENGGAEFCFTGDNLLYTIPGVGDKMLYSTPKDSLFNYSANLLDRHIYRMAEGLSRQERSLAEKKKISWPEEDIDVEYSESKPYRKAGHILRFHSWVPVYFDYDKIRSMSADYTYEYASAGATALFQNDLGTASGSIGYSWHKDPYSYVYGDSRHRHSGHLKFTYSGLYPVFEISADINDRAAIQYSRNNFEYNDLSTDRITGKLLDRPYAEGRFRAYIPLDFSNGGWNRGIIPQISYTVGNDLFDKSSREFSYDGNFSGKDGMSHFTGYTRDNNVFMQKLSAGLSAYIMRPKAASEVYPQYGIGLQAGYTLRTGLGSMFTPSCYSMVYGYLPGITRTQGVMISALYQHQKTAGLFRENGIDISPRGFTGSSVTSYLELHSRNQLKISIDYAIPIWVGDISCFSPLFYIKNFELTPRFDFMTFSEGRSMSDGNLFSAGFKLTARLGNFLWLPYDTRIGFTVDFNGGNAIDNMKKSGCPVDSHHIGFVFDISL
ncbi:MAG: TolB family protein [Candidatus Cryptobacteroides sp.]